MIAKIETKSPSNVWIVDRCTNPSQAFICIFERKPNFFIPNMKLRLNYSLQIRDISAHCNIIIAAASSLSKTKIDSHSWHSCEIVYSRNIRSENFFVRRHPQHQCPISLDLSSFDLCMICEIPWNHLEHCIRGCYCRTANRFLILMHFGDDSDRL